MPPLDHATEELLQLSASQADEAARTHQRVKDTRRVIEESRRLLESPVWSRMESVWFSC